VPIGTQRGYSAVAVDPATNTIYLGTYSGALLVIDGRTCNGTDVSGCGRVLARVPVAKTGSADHVAGVAVHHRTDADIVTVLKTSTCSAGM
jgi:hypothetical protein